MSANLDIAERRKGPRVEISADARVRPWSAHARLWESSSLVDYSPTGFRLRTGLSLQQRDVIVLLRDGDRNILHAEVVWSRADGLIDKGPASRCGRAYLAGCRFLFDPPGATFRRACQAVGRGIVRTLVFSGKAGVLLSALALVGLVVYFLAFVIGMLFR